MDKYGVIGAGSFGTAVANLLARNGKVLLYARNLNVVKSINEHRENRGQQIHENVLAVNNPQEATDGIQNIFIAIPSENFKDMMSDLSDSLSPEHILIHCTKGLHVDRPISPDMNLDRTEVKTMSELIVENSVVLRVGCMAGPNLAREIADGQPAATVIASRFDEVIRIGQKALTAPNFQVYGSHDIKGIELAGILKNYIAIAAGALNGLGYGENARALLVSRGMAEMIYIGRAFGATERSFLGIAGIGDLMATCTSPLSRNFTVGNRIAKGQKLEQIKEEMEEVAEGVKTVQVIKALADAYHIPAPIVQTIYKVLFEDMSLQEGIEHLMRMTVTADAEFIH